jgi:hypothetical protein
MIIDMHVDWHHNNDPGGRNGPGSGVAFLGMHRSMMNAFRQYALNTGQRSYISLNTNAPLPDSVPDAYNPLMAAGQSYFDTWYGPRQGTDLTGINTPPYLTASGGPAVGMWSSQFTFFAWQDPDLAGPVYSKLGDIPDLDTLGRIIGSDNGMPGFTTPDFHGEIHGFISGTMGDLGSPSDPMFYAWCVPRSAPSRWAAGRRSRPAPRLPLTIAAAASANAGQGLAVVKVTVAPAGSVSSKVPARGQATEK